jgi:hypothetical protein
MRLLRTVLACALCALHAIACSGTSAGGAGSGAAATASGSVDGISLDPQGAFAYVGPLADGGAMLYEAFIFLPGFGSSCTPDDSVVKANSQSLSLWIPGPSGTRPLEPATYHVMPGNWSPTLAGPLAHFYADDTQCRQIVSNSDVTGTVTLTAIDASHVAGSFDLTFSPNGDHLTGTFSAPVCADVSTLLHPNPPANPKCVP